MHLPRVVTETFQTDKLSETDSFDDNDMHVKWLRWRYVLCALGLRYIAIRVRDRTLVSEVNT